MPSPVCLINNQTTLNGAIDVSAGSAVTISIANPVGVNVWKIECFGTDETSNQATVNSQLAANKNNVALTTSYTAGAAGTTFNFRSTINNGIDLDGRTARPDYIQTFQVCVLVNGTRVLAMSESMESDPQFGWLAKFNKPIRTGVTAVTPFTAGGDLSGTNTSQTVAKIQGVTIAGTAAVGRTIVGTSATTAAWSDQSGAFTAGGDLSGSAVNQTVARINGASVPSAGALTSGHVLKVSGSAATTYGYVTDANVDSAAAISGSKVNPNFGGQLVQTTNIVQAPTVTLGSGGPTITSGAAVPVSSPPSGSVYLRTDGTLYARTSSAWTPIGIGSVGGDLSGSLPNPTVVALTGSAGVVSSAGSIRFTAGITPVISQLDQTTNSVNGANLTVRPQNATGTSSYGGNLVLTSGTGTLGGGGVLLQVGGATLLSLSGTSMNIGAITQVENGDSKTVNTQVINNVQSTDATVQNLASGTLPNGVTVIDTVVTALKSDYTVAAVYKKSMTYRVNAGVVTAVGSLTDGGTKTDSGAASWSCIIDNSGTTYRVRVTGLASNTIRWSSTTRTQSTAP